MRTDYENFEFKLYDFADEHNLRRSEDMVTLCKMFIKRHLVKIKKSED
jgi:hypothetical protein